jgi:hypothetical protein
MAIVQYGSVNTNALIVPGVTVQIVPPSIVNLNGVPTNGLGIVGTASWGPVNTPTVVGDLSGYTSTFGPVENRKYDAGTQVATAVLQAANNFTIVRVTDGTDVAASSVFQVANTNAVTLTATSTGSYGDNIAFSFNTGSKASTIKVLVQVPSVASETYDNLPSTGTLFWPALVDAINHGNTNYALSQSPSKLVSATVGTSTTAPTTDGSWHNLTGGTDGATSANATTLIGSDATPRTGMYALRKQNVTLGILADADTSTVWSTQAAFGLQEGIYWIATTPSGDTISNAATTRVSAGLDSPWVKLMFGDWLYWSDATNSVTRLVSPQGFIGGLLANLAPNESTLNKPIYGIAGSQKAGISTSGAATVYSDAEIQALLLAGLDVVANPSPGGAYWAAKGGQNSSSSANVNGDNYTRMTAYIALTLNTGTGIYIGAPITSTLLLNVQSTLTHFLSNMQSQGLISVQEDGSLPYTVKVTKANNPQTRTSLGYVQADVQVVYEAITKFLLANVEGGQTVITTVNQAA